jgi:hypothetical protein
MHGLHEAVSYDDAPVFLVPGSSIARRSLGRGMAPGAVHSAMSTRPNVMSLAHVYLDRNHCHVRMLPTARHCHAGKNESCGF